jgi:hypothetical protein
MAWFKVVTNYRTFIIEAAGMGDAIERALNLITDFNGEYIRSVDPEPQTMQVAA